MNVRMSISASNIATDTKLFKIIILHNFGIQCAAELQVLSQACFSSVLFCFSRKVLTGIKQFQPL